MAIFPFCGLQVQNLNLVHIVSVEAIAKLWEGLLDVFGQHLLLGHTNPNLQYRSTFV